MPNPFDAFSIDYRLPDDGLAHMVRIHVRDLGPGISVQGNLGYQRNLEAQELKVVTANMHQAVWAAQTSNAAKYATGPTQRYP